MTSTTERARLPFSLADAIEHLARTPRLLDVWLGDLPQAWLDGNEGGETWSARDVVGHLIHGEHTDWVPRARVIVEHGASRPFDTFDRFAQFAASEGKTLAALLDDFAAARRDSLQALAALNLTERDLDRAGTHPELGPVTLRQLLATWVAHDLDHVMQCSRVLARQYADEVGPWRAYLRVISGSQG